eukprot:3022392-Lingulodinium_polyedra.AAC.1
MSLLDLCSRRRRLTSSSNLAFRLKQHNKPRDCVVCQWAKHKARYKPRLRLLDGVGEHLRSGCQHRPSVVLGSDLEERRRRLRVPLHLLRGLCVPRATVG